MAQRLTQIGLAVLVAGAGVAVHSAPSAADAPSAGRPATADLASKLDDATPADGTPGAATSGGATSAGATPGDAVPSGAVPGEGAPGGDVSDFPDGSFGRAPLRIMPLGDSLTWGKGSSDGSGYRVDLSSWLSRAGVDTDFVGSLSNGSGPDLNHEGHPGWRIAQIDAQLDIWVPAAAPDVILLDIGTNDLLHRDALATAPARLAALVDHLIELAPNARIVLAKLLVVRPEFKTFNAALPSIAAARPGHVWLADMSRIPQAETVDHVHPTDLGYRAMAAEWYHSLTRVVPAARSWPALTDS